MKTIQKETLPAASRRASNLACVSGSTECSVSSGDKRNLDVSRRVSSSNSAWSITKDSTYRTNNTKTTVLNCNLFKNLQQCSTWFKSFVSQLVVLCSRYNAVVLHAFELLADVGVHIFLNFTLYGEKWCGSCSSYSTARGKDTWYLQDRKMGALHRICKWLWRQKSYYCWE